MQSIPAALSSRILAHITEHVHSEHHHAASRSTLENEFYKTNSPFAKMSPAHAVPRPSRNQAG